jgi:glycosyltransferase involved in cell wall biosynthesis
VALYASLDDNGAVKAISDTAFIDAIDIPSELQDKTIGYLITECKVRDGKLVSKCKAGKEIKVALVSNYRQRCGVSTYFESLCSKLLPQLNDYKLFVEYTDNPTASFYDLDGYALNTDRVLECWKRGEPLNELVEAIKAYDPDVVLISHEYGIWPIARYWLSLMTQLSDYRIITTLHSVFPDHHDKTVIEASIPECIVHLDGAKQALLNKGVSNKVSVIPHGCYTAEQKPLWDIYRSKHTFIQVGFGLRYKGWPSSIRAAGLLKDKYSDLFFTGLFSETDFNAVEHHAYYQELLALVNELGLQNHVGLLRGFKTDQAINAYMRTNQICVLPYASEVGHTVFGASGAARLAMASGVPVISSSIHHFEDLPTIKADTPETIAEALDKLFSSKEMRDEQIETQNIHVAANDWHSVAKKYHDLLTLGQ